MRDGRGLIIMEALPANDSLSALKAREAELRRLNDQLEKRKAVVVRRAEEAVVRELRSANLRRSKDGLCCAGDNAYHVFPV